MNTTEETTDADAALADQRRLLRRQLLAQRELIARQIDPVPGENGYPRSMTMRFLLQRPRLIIQLLLGLIALLKSR